MSTTWQPTDCHAHSTHSDGALSVAEVADRGKSLGIRATVSDHISHDAPTTIDSLAAVDGYLDDLEQHDVLRGGEFCWHDPLWRELPAQTVQRFTHRVGSLHSITLPNGKWFRAFNTALPEGLSPSDYIGAHVSTLETFALQMPVDILAHPTLVPPPLRVIDPHDLWSEDLEERAVRALLEAGIAFEISARYKPHARLVARAVAAGVRISLGSDGHTREQVGDIVRPLAMARALGVRDEDLYDPLRHGSRTSPHA